MSKRSVHLGLCLTSACSHRNRSKNTAFAMETLRAEQKLRLSEAMPEPRMLPPEQAKNTAIWMENLRAEQALQQAPVHLRPCLTPIFSHFCRAKTP